MALPGVANERWSLDFVSDALSNGRRFRVLAVVDESWADLGDYSCDPRIKDRLLLP